MGIYLQVIYLFNFLDRYGHSATVFRHNILYFGGWEFGKALNDIKLLDMKDNAWVQLKTNGQPPQPRFGHTLSFVSKILYSYIFK